MYPSFPILRNRNVIDPFIQMLAMDAKVFVSKLKVTDDWVRLIEEGTCLQSMSNDWFKERKYRLTASINNKFVLIKCDWGHLQNFIFAATPDGKVYDISEKASYSWSERLRRISKQWNIIHLSKSSRSVIDGKIELRKDHSNYLTSRWSVVLAFLRSCVF